MSNITVVPIGAERASVEAVKESFRAFRGEQAECFLAADRHKLLGVIEASFGDFREFDRLVRNMLEARRQKTDRGPLTQAPAGRAERAPEPSCSASTSRIA